MCSTFLRKPTLQQSDSFLRFWADAGGLVMAAEDLIETPTHGTQLPAGHTKRIEINASARTSSQRAPKKVQERRETPQRCHEARALRRGSLGTRDEPRNLCLCENSSRTESSNKQLLNSLLSLAHTVILSAQIYICNVRASN